ncbi:MAG: NRDE family protein [Ekhidna sp.]|uniref:NRDE family protein n=1 Tax=Ekhidna sp. TaxID=2608089 RepID=UPI0032EECFD8
MCLITFAYNAHPDYKFILAGNRDEFYSRPTAVAHWWHDHQHIFGGRDLQAQGTWMAISKGGKFAAVTNYRDIRNIRSDANSRGDLPVNFLLGDEQPESYAKSVQMAGKSYNGFNLLVMDDELVHASNYERGVNNLKPGIYGLSNALLDTPWPKVTRSKRAFSEFIQTDFSLDDLIVMMQDEGTAPDDQLPETGLDYTREKALSAMCIRTPDYGTCCTTAITIDYDGKVEFMEKSYPVGGRKDQMVTQSFKIDA